MSSPLLGALCGTAVFAIGLVIGFLVGEWRGYMNRVDDERNASRYMKKPLYPINEYQDGRLQ